MEVSNLWDRVRPRMQYQLQQGLGQHEIADFCKVAPSTVKDWINNAHPPRGERLLRLWHLLALRGSDSPELQKLPAFNRYLAELLVFGLVSMEEACEMAGVKNSQNLHKVLRGQDASHPNVSKRELVRDYDEQLGAAKSQLTSSPPPAASPKSQAGSMPARTSVPASSSLNVSTILQDAAHLGSALILARYYNSDETSPEERSKLRSLMGEGVMFELSNHLNALCSERSRNEGR